MKYILLLALFALLSSCKEKIDGINIPVMEVNAKRTEKRETIIWLDTISNDKFLKVYSKPENDWQNLTAEFGNGNKKHKVDLTTNEFKMLGIPFSNHIEWITSKSFALVNGCGTNCRYVLIFNTELEKPIVMPIDYYPNIPFPDFSTNNPNLYISTEQYDNDFLNLIIIDTDSQKKERVNLPKDWNRGNNNIYNIIDKIEIRDSLITIVQIEDDGSEKELKQFITLE